MKPIFIETLEGPDNHLLHAMVEHACRDLIDFVTNNEKDIRRDIDRTQKQQDDPDKPLKFKLSLGIVLNLDKSTVETSASYGLKSQAKEKHAIPDPNEPELPFPKP